MPRQNLMAAQLGVCSSSEWLVTGVLRPHLELELPPFLHPCVLDLAKPLLGKTRSGMHSLSAPSIGYTPRSRGHIHAWILAARNTDQVCGERGGHLNARAKQPKADHQRHSVNRSKLAMTNRCWRGKKNQAPSRTVPTSPPCHNVSSCCCRRPECPGPGPGPHRRERVPRS